MSTKKRAKIALRDRVWADAARALGPSRFHAVYGPGAVAQIIHGTVLEMVGQGHGRKWRSTTTRLGRVLGPSFRVGFERQIQIWRLGKPHFSSYILYLIILIHPQDLPER